MKSALQKLQSGRNVSLHDIASPKPSRAASRVVSGALNRAAKRQTDIQKKAASLRP